MIIWDRERHQQYYIAVTIEKYSNDQLGKTCSIGGENVMELTNIFTGLKALSTGRNSWNNKSRTCGIEVIGSLKIYKRTYYQTVF